MSNTPITSRMMAHRLAWMLKPDDGCALAELPEVRFGDYDGVRDLGRVIVSLGGREVTVVFPMCDFVTLDLDDFAEKHLATAAQALAAA